jgi:hypothetical protein
MGNIQHDGGRLNIQHGTRSSKKMRGTTENTHALACSDRSVTSMILRFEEEDPEIGTSGSGYERVQPGGR